MTRWPCRCSRCRARKTFAKHPFDYIQEWRVRCTCGGTFTVDEYRKTKEHKRNTCRCSGLHYPHRRGCLWCNFGPDPTDEQMKARYGY